MLTKKNPNPISEEQAREQRKVDRRFAVQALLFCVVILTAICLLFTYVFMLNLIPSSSMENTIRTGDIVFATRFDKTDIQRYDIMVFTPPDDPDTYYIKRVIGLPGETILVKDGNVYAGHERLDDSFLPEEMNRSGDGIYGVPEGCYFMLGDNRNLSKDARFWENKYVPLENMVAKAVSVIFPFNHIDNLHYQGPADGNAAAASVDGSEGIHTWVTTQEDGADLVLRCRECGQRQLLEQLQITDAPGDGCARHLLSVNEVGFLRTGEEEMELVVDSWQLRCRECGWSATGVPVSEE